MTESVPCNGCTDCCRGPNRRFVVDATVPGFHWRTQVIDGETHLAMCDDGDCVYLGPGGCTIQDDKPRECSAFDCRANVLNPAMRSRTVVAAIRALGRTT